MATINAVNKITKMLSLAFKNSNKEEATSAFRQAYSLMQRESVTYEELFNVEIYEGADPKASNSQREAELVEKYNQLLIRAKNLKAELEAAKSDMRVNPAVQAEFDKIKAELAEAYNQVHTQAVEILRLRDEGKSKKYTLKDLGVCILIAGIAGAYVGGSMVSNTTKTVYVDRPVSVSTPSTTASNTSVAPTPVEAPVEAPTLVKSYVIKYGSVTKDTKQIKDRFISVYSDGSLVDSVNGKSTFISGVQYRSATGKIFTFEEVNNNIVRIDNVAIIAGSPKDTSLDTMARSMKEVNGKVLNDLKAKGIDCYLTTSANEYISLCAIHDIAFTSDLNGFGESKEYAYDSVMPDGSMKYVRKDSSKYVTIQGSPFFMSDRNMNNYILSFRGNPVIKLNN